MFDAKRLESTVVEFEKEVSKIKSATELYEKINELREDIQIDVEAYKNLESGLHDVEKELALATKSLQEKIDGANNNLRDSIEGHRKESKEHNDEVATKLHRLKIELSDFEKEFKIRVEKLTHSLKEELEKNTNEITNTRNELEEKITATTSELQNELEAKLNNGLTKLESKIRENQEKNKKLMFINFSILGLVIIILGYIAMNLN